MEASHQLWDKFRKGPPPAVRPSVEKEKKKRNPAKTAKTVATEEANRKTARTIEEPATSAATAAEPATPTAKAEEPAAPAAVAEQHQVAVLRAGPTTVAVQAPEIPLQPTCQKCRWLVDVMKAQIIGKSAGVWSCKRLQH